MIEVHIISHITSQVIKDRLITLHCGAGGEVVQLRADSSEQAASSTQRTCDSSRRQRAASRQQQWHPASASTCCGDRHQRATNEQAAHLPPPGKVANRGQRAASEPRAAAASSSNRPSTPSDFCHTSRKSKAFICFILLERTCPKTTKQRDLQESEILSR